MGGSGNGRPLQHKINQLKPQQNEREIDRFTDLHFKSEKFWYEIYPRCHPKNAEGAFVPENRAWHEANRTYTFSYGLGALIMSIGILVFLGIFFPKVGLAGDTLAIIMTLGTLSFLVTTPEVWVPDLGSGEFGFPLLSGAGRLVIKDIVILASAVVLLSDSSQRVLKTLKKD